MLAELFATYTVETVVIILAIGIPAIIKGIGSVKALWKKRTDFITENVRRGHEEEAQKETQMLEKAATEARLSAVEKNIDLLTEIASQQKEQINLLIKSDKLDIKAWIKAQHDYWIPRGYIDSQILDLLEERYEIYKKENGNSWAKKLMDELRALPTISVFPINNN